MKGIVAICLLVILGLKAGAAGPLMLQPAQTINAGTAALNPGGQSIPCVTDWNGDGLPDLIVGYQPASKLALYLNSGSAAQPVFTTWTNLQAGGSDIWHPSGGCGAPAPWVCDYNGDSRRDLLVGSGADGKVWAYINTNTDAQPMLTGGVTLSRGSAELSVGYRATPYTHDWDEDGLPDLLCGDGNGNVHWFRNTGTPQSPSCTSDVLIQAGGVALNLGYRSAVRICDWNGDGLKDLVGTGADNAVWCRNTGKNSSPVLSAPERLRAPVAGIGLTNIDTGYRMRLELFDWNQDGTQDLLIGSWDGFIYLYESYRFLLSVGGSGPDKNCVLEWKSAPFLNYNVLSGTAPNNLGEFMASNFPSAGKRTCWTNPLATGAHFFRVHVAQ